jgi:inorganic triphosphatase YgiF
MHQLRVAIRRLRSAFGAFADMLPASDRHRFARDLKSIATACGRAREFDVFADEILVAARKRLKREPALAVVRAVAARARTTAWKRARTVIASPRFTDLMLALEGWLETGAWRVAAGDAAGEKAQEFARRALKRLHRKVAKAGDGIAALTEPELHKVRLRAKKLRYAASSSAACSRPRRRGATWPRRGGAGPARRAQRRRDGARGAGGAQPAAARGRARRVRARRGAGDGLERGARRERDRGPAEVWRRFTDEKPFWK